MKECPRCNTKHNKNGTFCSRSCANSRIQTEEIRKKKSETLKKFYKENDNPNTGKSGWKHSEEDKNLKRLKMIEFWDKKGRRTQEDIKIKNRIGVSNYRARKYSATPDNANSELIKMIYKMCPEGHEVDHIIPLIEGGLHHEDNLQYLPSMENRKKNKYQNYDRSLIINWQDLQSVAE